MATMVARGGSPLASPNSIQEKGSRNKRKFRADTPPIELNSLTPPMQPEYAGYEFFPMEKAPDDSGLDCHACICDMCRVPYYAKEEDVELEEPRDTDWSDLTETQLEEAILTNLDTVFKSAIKKIASCGYPEEVAMNSVLRPGICYGCKDTISNIVDNALASLRNGQEVDASVRVNFDEDLRKFEKNVLAEMVNVLRDVRPFFSNGDAMWCLLICDLNVTHACAVDNDPLNIMENTADTSCNSTVPTFNLPPNPTVSTPQTTLKFNAPALNKLNAVSPFPQISPQIGTPSVVGVPNLPSGRFCSLGNGHSLIPNFSLGRDYPSCSSNRLGESSCLTTSQTSLTEEKRSGGRKSHVGISKRESTLRQKSLHFEKSYRAFGSKAALRASKHSGLGSLVADRKCKPASIPTGANMKSASLKLGKATGTETSQGSKTLNLAFSSGQSVSSPYSTETTSNLAPLPFASTELSLSLPSTSNIGVSSKPNYSIKAASCSSYPGNLSDKMCENWIPHDKKDDILSKLVPRVQELQGQLQEWDEWAQQKVMQATRRLGKDKAELKSLRQEKEEAARVEKEKQNVDENTKKRLSEMGLALTKANGQIEKATGIARKLEVDNAVVRQQMEAAKLLAAQSAVNHQEVSTREMKARKKFQSWEKEKALFQEELMTEKRKLSDLLRQYEKDKEAQDQIQGKRKLEDTIKDELLMQASSVRKEREQIETSGRGKENAMRIKAETDLQRYKADIRRLEDQIGQLRLKTDSSKKAAARWGADGSCASLLSDRRKNGAVHAVAKMMDSLDLGVEDVQRERECVMCLTEEMSVVFLPCLHQVVCAECSELHEKQGMKDCPSCRTPIQRRISVRTSDS